MYDTQLPSQQRIGESALTLPKKSLDEGSLIGSYEFLLLKDPRVWKNPITLLNKYYDVIFFNNSFKSGRERIQSWMEK